MFFLLYVCNGIVQNMCDMCIGKLVHNFFARSMRCDQSLPAQHPKVLRDKRLAGARSCGEIVDTCGLCDQTKQYLQPKRVTECPIKTRNLLNIFRLRVFHIKILAYVYISC
jgi:hypothetical protein